MNEFSLGPLLLASFVFFFALVGCSKKEAEEAEAEQPPAKVKTIEVEERSFSDRVEALGTVRALEAIDISSNVTDRVVELFFQDGDSVKKGDLLVRLDDAEEAASVEAARVGQTEQEREIERLRSLVEDGAVSEVRLEEYRTQRDIAMQLVEEAKAKLADRQITAPFDGTLGFRQVSLGALVSPGDIIATLDILDPVKLDFTVPETFLSDLKQGLEITALSEAYPDQEFSGKVTQIDTRVNPVTRSITVRAEIPNPDRKLRPGMLMTTVLEKNPQESLSIPERALVSVQSNHFVFVLKDPAAETPTVERRKVLIGRRIPGYVEVTEGLEQGTAIVTDGLIGLTDGGAVSVTGSFDSPAEPYQPSAL